MCYLSYYCLHLMIINKLSKPPILASSTVGTFRAGPVKEHPDPQKVLTIYLLYWKHQICVHKPYLKRINKSCLVCKMFKNMIWIQSGLARTVWQIWVSGPVQSGNSVRSSPTYISEAWSLIILLTLSHTCVEAHTSFLNFFIHAGTITLPSIQVALAAMHTFLWIGIKETWLV